VVGDISHDDAELAAFRGFLLEIVVIVPAGLIAIDAAAADVDAIQVRSGSGIRLCWTSMA